MYQDENVIVVDSNNNVFGVHYKRIFMTEALASFGHIEKFQFKFQEFTEALDKNLIKFVKREDGNFFKLHKKVRKLIRHIQFTEEMLEEWQEDSVIAEEAYHIFNTGLSAHNGHVKMKYLAANDLDGFLEEFVQQGGNTIQGTTIYELNEIGRYMHNCILSIRKFLYRLETILDNGIIK